MKDRELLTLVVHADWSCGTFKRWMALARLGPDGRYRVQVPEPVQSARRLLQRLLEAAGANASCLVGFDFPMGLPFDYAQKAGINSFLSFLDEYAQGKWPLFDQPALRPDEICLQRPFYPDRAGSARQQHLLDGLGVNHIDLLRRLCERQHPNQRAAAPLFWTMGGQQVGKAALSGWREVLVPALAGPGRFSSEKIGIWPFSGRLNDLHGPGRLVIVEVYPAECYRRIGIAFSRSRQGQKSGKRIQQDRSNQCAALFAWAARRQVLLEPALMAQLSDGFGAGAKGEDHFDAVAGLLGMLDLILSDRRDYEPEGMHLRNIEGWIFGMPVLNEAV